ncbi:mCG146827 [Mus musculus]|nr:mCG146827 [Mus musculus]
MNYSQSWKLARLTHLVPREETLAASQMHPVALFPTVEEANKIPWACLLVALILLMRLLPYDPTKYSVSQHQVGLGIPSQHRSSGRTRILILQQ